MTAHPSAVRAYCRADKAARDRALYLLAHTTAEERAISRDAEYRAHRAEAGRWWRKLPGTVRAAILNPDAEGAAP